MYIEEKYNTFVKVGPLFLTEAFINIDPKS